MRYSTQVVPSLAQALDGAIHKLCFFSYPLKNTNTYVHMFLIRIQVLLLLEQRVCYFCLR